jgi:hypothetical protein
MPDTKSDSSCDSQISSADDSNTDSDECSTDYKHAIAIIVLLFVGCDRFQYFGRVS